MIRFACLCQMQLSVTDDRAGSSMQCPFCGKLIDVPLLSELDAVDADGTYKFGGEEHAEHEEDRLAELQHVFAKQRTDRHGNDIDLRNTYEDLAGVGVPTEEDDQRIRLQGDEDDDGEVRKVPGPKYDPI